MSAFVREVEMTFDPQCMPEAPRKIEWAGVGPRLVDQPLRVKTNGGNRNQVLLSLPRFRDVDILDLIRLAENEGNCRVSDRISAIAVLVGNESLDSPKFQQPLVVKLGPGMPKYL